MWLLYSCWEVSFYRNNNRFWAKNKKLNNTGKEKESLGWGFLMQIQNAGPLFLPAPPFVTQTAIRPHSNERQYICILSGVLSGAWKVQRKQTSSLSTLKGVVHPRMKTVSSFTCLHASFKCIWLLCNTKHEFLKNALATSFHILKVNNDWGWQAQKWPKSTMKPVSFILNHNLLLNFTFSRLLKG